MSPAETDQLQGVLVVVSQQDLLPLGTWVMVMREYPKLTCSEGAAFAVLPAT